LLSIYKFNDNVWNWTISFIDTRLFRSSQSSLKISKASKFVTEDSSESGSDSDFDDESTEATQNLPRQDSIPEFVDAPTILDGDDIETEQAISVSLDSISEDFGPSNDDESSEEVEFFSDAVSDDLSLGDESDDINFNDDYVNNEGEEMEGPKAQTISQLPNEFGELIIMSTQYDIVLWDPKTSTTLSRLDNIFESHIPSNHPYLNHFNRISFKESIPELGLMIYATQAGAVAVIRLKKTTSFTLSLESIISTTQYGPLSAMAVTPHNTHADFLAFYRLLLFPFDGSLLQYEIRTIGDLNDQLLSIALVD
jgi:hypothetical protein